MIDLPHAQNEHLGHGSWLLWRFFLFEEAAKAVNGIGWSFAGVFSDARAETSGTA
jgi:hypothetical protein